MRTWHFPHFIITHKFFNVAFLQSFPRNCALSYETGVLYAIQGEDHMNRYMQEKWPWIEGTHGMRSQLTDILSDADLSFSPGGQNMTLGALLREMGESEYSYTQSLKTF